MKKLVYLITLITIFVLMSSVLTMALEDVDMDLGGQTVTVGIWHGGMNSQFEEGAGKAHLEDVEKAFNVEIDFHSAGWNKQSDLLQSNVLAGDHHADVLLWQSAWAADNYDYLYPLNKKLDDDIKERMAPIGITDPWDVSVFAGDYYSLPRAQEAAVEVILWNKDLFEKENLPDLYELVENGEWTWEAFRDIAAQATQDLNNDGEIDQWGFVGPFFDHTFPWFYANNAPTMVEEDGRMVFNGDSPAFLETLDFYKDLLLEDNVIGSGDFHESLDLFLSGNAAMRIANSFGHGLGDMEDDFGVVPLPKGPNAEEYTAVAPRTNVMVVPLTVENPAEKLEVVLALYEEAEPYTDTEAKANQFWDEWATDNNIRDMESVEIFRDLNDKAFLSYSRQILEDHIDEIFEILDGEISASAQIEAITPEVQEKIDNRFN